VDGEGCSSLGITVSIEGKASAVLNEDVQLNANIKFRNSLPGIEVLVDRREERARGEPDGILQIGGRRDVQRQTQGFRAGWQGLAGCRRAGSPDQNNKSKAVDVTVDGPAKAKPTRRCN